MCRHLAYLGPSVPLSALLLDPPHGLQQQAWAPRRQHHGVVNADGFGIGWYPPGSVEPLRHRGSGPIWGDETVAELSRSQHAVGVLASVRSATAGTAYGTAAAMPFRSGRFLFAHNGALDGWPDAAAPLAETLGVRRLLRLEAMTDAALLWALVQERLADGAPPAAALGEVVRRAAEVCGGRLNLLLTDGTTIAATAWGASLSHRTVAGGTLVASEPLDDGPGWVDVPDLSLLYADATGVDVAAL